MTAQELMYDIRALFDEYNEDGVVISPEDVATLQANGLRVLSMTIQEIFAESKEFKEVNFLNDRVPNLLGDLSQFNIEQFIGEDQHYPNNSYGVVGAKAYFFTLDDDATVLIREYNGTSWNVLKTLNLTPTTKTDYKGLITPTDPSYPIELVFSGSTFYRHQNRCLFSYPFKADAIPDYIPWFRYEMPDDFGELDQVIAEYPERQYSEQPNYKWEGFKTLVVNYFYDGSIKVIYKPRPPRVETLDQEINIANPIALEFVKYATAAKLALTEDSDMVNFLEGKANELKFEAFKNQPASEEDIIDVYSKGWYWWLAWHLEKNLNQ